jgi:hypothetical protein
MSSSGGHAAVVSGVSSHGVSTVSTIMAGRAGAKNGQAGRCHARPLGLLKYVPRMQHFAQRQVRWAIHGCSTAGTPILQASCP